MVRVNVEDIQRLHDERKKYNDLDFDSIEWYKDGKKLEISPQVLEDFKFTGLTNCCFAAEEMYNLTDFEE